MWVVVGLWAHWTFVDLWACCFDQFGAFLRPCCSQGWPFLDFCRVGILLWACNDVDLILGWMKVETLENWFNLLDPIITSTTTTNITTYVSQITLGIPNNLTHTSASTSVSPYNPNTVAFMNQLFSRKPHNTSNIPINNPSSAHTYIVPPITFATQTSQQNPNQNQISPHILQLHAYQQYLTQINQNQNLIPQNQNLVHQNLNQTSQYQIPPNLQQFINQQTYIPQPPPNTGFNECCANPNSKSG